MAQHGTACTAPHAQRGTSKHGMAWHSTRTSLMLAGMPPRDASTLWSHPSRAFGTRAGRFIPYLSFNSPPSPHLTSRWGPILFRSARGSRCSPVGVQHPSPHRRPPPPPAPSGPPPRRTPTQGPPPVGPAGHGCPPGRGAGGALAAALLGTVGYRYIWHQSLPFGSIGEGERKRKTQLRAI